MGGKLRTITRTIREFPVGGDQEQLHELVTELIRLMEDKYRFGRIMLIWHEGSLVKIEVERSEKEKEGEIIQED